MEVNNLFGMPAHPLLVHLPLVLIPLASLLALAAVVVPRHRKRLSWVAVAVTAIALVSAQFAIVSGEALDDRVKRSELVRDHTSMGDSVRLYAFVLLIALIALAVVPHSTWSEVQAKRRRTIIGVVSAIVVVAAVANVVSIVRVGHSGAKAVWNDTPAQRPSP